MGLYDDGRPGELFITMAKEGSTIGGLMDCFGTAVSMSLQYGVPLEVYVNKFSHTRFEPMGHTKNPDIRIAKSIVDYIFRWLGITVPARLSRGDAGQRGRRRAAPASRGGRRGNRAEARRQEGRRARTAGQDRPANGNRQSRAGQAAPAAKRPEPASRPRPRSPTPRCSNGPA